MLEDTPLALKHDIEVAAEGGRRRSIIDLARRLESLSLESDYVSDDLFEVYCYVLTNPLLCAKDGVDAFASGLFNDFSKLSEHQRKRLLGLLIEQGSLFSDSMLRISIGDLVARKFSAEVAIDVFAKLWDSGNENCRDIAYSGAQVLSRIVPSEGRERNALRKFGGQMMGG